MITSPGARGLPDVEKADSVAWHSTGASGHACRLARRAGVGMGFAGFSEEIDATFRPRHATRAIG